MLLLQYRKKSDAVVVRDVSCQIVVTITFSQYVPMILRAANTIFGEDMKKLVWFSGGVPVADVLDSNQDLFEEDPELLRLVEGMIGISASPAATQVASRLKVVVQPP